MTGSSFKKVEKEGSFKLSLRKKLLMRRVKTKTLAWVAQRAGTCPIPGNIQDRVGLDSEQPALLEDVPDQCRDGWSL